jgi:hypothetical protein
MTVGPDNRRLREDSERAGVHSAAIGFILLLGMALFTGFSCRGGKPSFLWVGKADWRQSNSGIALFRKGERAEAGSLTSALIGQTLSG